MQIADLKLQICGRHGRRYSIISSNSSEAVLPLRGAAERRWSCRGSTLVAVRQLILFSLDSMGWAVAFRLGGASIVSPVESHLPLLKELWLAVDKVVHHYDVIPAIIVRPSKAASPIEEIRTQARLEAVVCAMCWAVPVDERICYLFRCGVGPYRSMNESATCSGVSANSGQSYLSNW